MPAPQFQQHSLCPLLAIQLSLTWALLALQHRKSNGYLSWSSPGLRLSCHWQSDKNRYDNQKFQDLIFPHLIHSLAFTQRLGVGNIAATLAMATPTQRLAMATTLAMSIVVLLGYGNKTGYGDGSSSSAFGHGDTTGYGSSVNTFGYANIIGQGHDNSSNMSDYGNSTGYGDGSSGGIFGYGNRTGYGDGRIWEHVWLWHQHWLHLFCFKFVHLGMHSAKYALR